MAGPVNGPAVGTNSILMLKTAFLVSCLFMATACTDSTASRTENPIDTPTLTGMLDRMKIEHLTQSFTDAVNQRNAEQFAELWVPNGAEWRIGPPVDTTFSGRAGMGEALTRMTGQWDYFYQALEGSVVDIAADGLSATGRVYTSERGMARTGQGNENLSFYEDNYRKVGENWYFLNRTYHTIYQEAPASPGERYWRPR